MIAAVIRAVIRWRALVWGLVVVGIVAARVGQIVLTWLQSRWVAWVQSGAALVIVGVGVVLTAVAWRTLTKLP